MSTIAIAYGRFNPPTIAHSMLFDRLLDYSTQNNITSRIYVSHSNDKNKNPLSLISKLYYLNSFFPEHSFHHTTKEYPSIFNVLTELNKKYNNIVLFVGSDRLDKFKKDLGYYNNKDYNFDSTKVISVGNRTNNDSLIESCSGTLLRNLVRENNYDLFCKYLPISTEDLKEELYSELKTILT